MSEKDGKWFIVNSEGLEILSTRGNSKEESQNALCEQMNMLNGSNNDWSYWSKQGFKVRKD